MKQYVYDFTEGCPDPAGLLGGKGAGLAEMTRLGLPVPPGFTVTSEACRVFRATGAPPEGLEEQLAHHLAALERATGKRLGRVDDPLLLSVRSDSGPTGTTDTVLDIGLNDLAVLGLGKAPGHERFAWDSYRRLVHMFGTTLMGVDGSLFEEIADRLGRRHAVADDSRFDTVDLITLVESFKDLIAERAGEEFPQDPAEQLRRAVLAVFAAPDAAPAAERLPGASGTAVTVQTMVFGNLGPDSGSGVAFVRDPVTGRPGLHGAYLPDTQGEDVLAAARSPLPLERLGELAPAVHGRLRACMDRLRAEHEDLYGVEFTVECGTLWILEFWTAPTARFPRRGGLRSEARP
ncbi:PEP/pyruvate-binding domain-containing protein [Streptomyces sp. NPDC001389]|uniref:PEP/pyruvate-binding domain-containing protein n=1 Tax=unclassified Streptomyces TaxID=2593676 RepID=UPI003690CD42